MSSVEIIIFDEEELTKTLIESYSKELSFSCALKTYDEFDVKTIESNNIPKILMVNINNNKEDIFDKMTSFDDGKNIKIMVNIDTYIYMVKIIIKTLWLREMRLSVLIKM